MNRQPATPSPRAIRRGVTLRESVVVLVIVAVVAAVALPYILSFWEDRRRDVCTGHLRQIGQAFNDYKSRNSTNTLPAGCRYQAETQSGGTSWWVDILPQFDADGEKYQWKNVANSGDFNHSSGSNDNTPWADGRHLGVFFCPSSPLPMFNDPQQHVSEANRKLVTGREPKGIPVPMYVAIAGSAPDALRYDPSKGLDVPFGRNTKDNDRWGILSASGVFPPNAPQSTAAVTDQGNRTIVVAEQSNFVTDDSLDPPDLYDVRSAWPKGAFMGTAGNYGEIKLDAPGIDGSGDQRCWNVTTVRYPLNHKGIKEQRGIVVDPPQPRPAKEGEKPPPPPPYPPEGYGPGHNQPLVSAHPGGVNLLMADGSTDFAKEDLDLGLLLQMSTRDDE